MTELARRSWVRLVEPYSPPSILYSTRYFTVQVVLFVAEHCMRQPSDERYPAGRSRIEPIGVIVVAVMMGIAAVEVGSADGLGL